MGIVATGLIDIMKRASMDAIENAKPCDLRYGTVISTNPLKVQVTNQFVLPAGVLIVPKHLSNYTIKVEITEENSGESAESASAKQMKIYNALKTGDKVAMIRQSGGQYYYILDRI